VRKPDLREDPGGDPRGDSLELVRSALAGLRFGEIVIAVHDGEIVQIARTEKIRTPRGAERT
jgi:hypothetical protein